MIKLNRILVSIGPITIYWYSIMILLGVIVASYFILKEAKRNNMKEYIENLIFYVLIFGIIGARLYYVVFYEEHYNLLSILEIWNGGLAIYGGIIFGIITVIYFAKKYKQGILKTTDILAPGLIIAQSIGRWGNFFNQEAFGGVVSKSFLQSLHIPNFIIKGMYINGFYYHPTFLYESISSIICFIVLILLRKKKNLKVGTLTSIYLIWYGIVRLLIESLRTDALLVGDIRIAQVVSLLSILIGLVVYRKTRDNKNYIDEKIQTK